MSLQNQPSSLRYRVKSLALGGALKNVYTLGVQAAKLCCICRRVLFWFSVDLVKDVNSSEMARPRRVQLGIMVKAHGPRSHAMPCQLARWWRYNRQLKGQYIGPSVAPYGQMVAIPGGDATGQDALDGAFG